MQVEPKFKRGDHVEKISGSKWRGIVVGEYSTTLTPEGYAVESETEAGSVQIYPAKALRPAEATRALKAQMPTIWEDPAGKGYPCFERPMTPAEAREAIERYGQRVVTLEEQIAELRSALEAEDDYWAASRALASVHRRLRPDAQAVFEAASERRDSARAALQHKEPQG